MLSAAAVYDNYNGMCHNRIVQIILGPAESVIPWGLLLFTNDVELIF